VINDGDGNDGKVMTAMPRTVTAMPMIAMMAMPMMTKSEFS